MEVKCQRCILVWDYKGDKKPNKNYPVYVICPRCRTTVKLISHKKKNKTRKELKEDNNKKVKKVVETSDAFNSK